MFENVELVGFPELDEVDVGLFQKAFEHFFSKVSPFGEAKLHLSLKEYGKGGLRVQHEVHAKLILATKPYFASDKGWQLMEVTQGVLKKLEREVLKKHPQAK